MRKILIFILTLTIGAGIINAAIYSGSCGDNLSWSLNTEDSTLTITGNGEMDNSWSYPSYAPWYSYINSIVYISLPEGLTSIGNNAFLQCTKLSSIEIPNSVKSIGYYAFLNCNRLHNIFIPKSIQTIGGMSFGWCKNLDSIFVDSNNQHYQSIDGVLFSKDNTILWQYPYGRNGAYTIPDSVNYIMYGAFHNCKNLTSITFSNSVTMIGEAAFAGCETLETIYIPFNVTDIYDEAFRGCENITKIYCEAENPPTLGNNVFKECTRLTSIYVPCGNKNNYIATANWNPYSSKIMYPPIPYEVNIAYDTTKGQIYQTGGNNVCDDTICNLFAVAHSGFHFVQWSDGITDNPRSFIITQDTTFTAEFAISTNGQCGDNLYWTYNDGKLSFSGSGEMFNYTYSSVPWKLFINDIKEVVFIDGMASIGNYACANMVNLEHINLPASVQSIGDYAFANINNRKISNLVLPFNIVSIGAYAFAGNTYIEQINFGKSIESIGAYAFQNCTRVTTMTCLADVTPEVGAEAFASISNYAELYILSSALRKYQVDDNWNRFLLKELGATETSYTGSIIVEPSDNTVTISWPINTDANTYTIELMKNGELFCTLVFTSNGQLSGIAFAPSRVGSHKSSAALQTANGLQFTITGLNSGTSYNYCLTTKNSSGTVIALYSGIFTTTGASQEETALDKIYPKSTPQKVLQEGQIFILSGDKTYTLQGQEVK